MKKAIVVATGMLVAWSATSGSTAAEKARVFVVSSYHRDYLWSQATTLTATDYVESSTTLLQKTGMDTQRKNNRSRVPQKWPEQIPSANEALLL